MLERQLSNARDKVIRRFTVALICLWTPGALTAQAKTAATVPVRELSVSEKSPHVFANIFQVRQIADQRVLVNDGLSRQLILLERNLAVSRIVLDSVASGSSERYGPGAVPIVAALGDSSWFVDRASRALLVIDPLGKVVRTTAGPADPMHFMSIGTSRSGVDANGNLLFRSFAPPVAKRIGDTTSKTIVTEQRPPATAAILRANFETRATDTIGAVKQVNGVRSVMTQEPSGSRTMRGFMHPLETVDDWAILTDGTVAFVRGADYHVDFVRPDGKRESGPKLPFDWKSIPESEKQRIRDSAKTAIDSIFDQAAAIGGIRAGNTAVAMAMEGMITRVGGTVPTPAPPVRKAVPGEPVPGRLNLEIVPVSEMPDYYPPIRQGAAMADADGNLWILPATSAQSKAGELVYDMVNGKGALVERVRLPLGRSIVGFGRSGIVYLMSKDGEGWRLERSTVRSR